MSDDKIEGSSGPIAPIKRDSSEGNDGSQTVTQKPKKSLSDLFTIVRIAFLDTSAGTSALEKTAVCMCMQNQGRLDETDPYRFG